jgi:hypothetical protein
MTRNSVGVMVVLVSLCVAGIAQADLATIGTANCDGGTYTPDL